MSKSELRRLNIQFEAKIAQLEEENKWMRREVERVGHALYTGTKTGYVGTEEDLHYIGQTVEGVCETNLRLMNIEAELEAHHTLGYGEGDECPLCVLEEKNERLELEVNYMEITIGELRNRIDALKEEDDA